MASKPILNVALVGYAFMGRAHSNAYQQVNRFFADCPFEVRRKVLIGRSQGPLEEAARTWGWEETANDLNIILGREDIHLVDVGTPNDSHHDLSIAALKAGKHVLCEKPLALTTAQAREMTVVAAKAKTADGKPVRTGVWHNYRRAPAAATAAGMIRDGKIGEVRHVRGVYLQDWLSDPKGPATWRMTAKACGSGAHGDLNAHLIDMTRFLTGLEFDEVSGLQQTFTKKRPAANGKGTITVDVDDALLFLAKMSNGATASFEATRVAAGRKNYNRIEINGTKGSLVWNFERMNELEFFSFEDEPRAQGFRTIMCMNGGAHPYAGNYWPDGHIIGYEHTFTNHLYDFLVALKSGKPFRPDFADGVANQEVLDASLESAKSSRWVKVEHSQKFAKDAGARALKKSAGISH
ncbi:MAG: Gfo/Idh/MocA family oxidoreductase [Planctomycetes bacterium]|nr:Gfo/Idh/MocA family oxidoreductase [Planctomycetota bacterium]